MFCFVDDRMCDFPVKKVVDSGRVELKLSHSIKYWPKRFVAVEVLQLKNDSVFLLA